MRQPSVVLQIFLCLLSRVGSSSFYCEAGSRRLSNGHEDENLADYQACPELNSSSKIVQFYLEKDLPDDPKLKGYGFSNSKPCLFNEDQLQVLSASPPKEEMGDHHIADKTIGLSFSDDKDNTWSFTPNTSEEERLLNGGGPIINLKRMMDSTDLSPQNQPSPGATPIETSPEEESSPRTDPDKEQADNAADEEEVVVEEENPLCLMKLADRNVTKDVQGVPETRDGTKEEDDSDFCRFGSLPGDDSEGDTEESIFSESGTEGEKSFKTIEDSDDEMTTIIKPLPTAISTLSATRPVIAEGTTLNIDEKLLRESMELIDRFIVLALLAFIIYRLFDLLMYNYY